MHKLRTLINNQTSDVQILLTTSGHLKFNVGQVALDNKTVGRLLNVGCLATAVRHLLPSRKEIIDVPRTSLIF